MSKKELKKEIQSLKDDIRILVERRDFIKVQEVEFRWSYLFLKEEFIWGTPLENTEATEVEAPKHEEEKTILDGLSHKQIFESGVNAEDLTYEQLLSNDYLILEKSKIVL